MLLVNSIEEVVQNYFTCLPTTSCKEFVPRIILLRTRNKNKQATKKNWMQGGASSSYVLSLSTTIYLKEEKFKSRIEQDKTKHTPGPRLKQDTVTATTLLVGKD